MGLAHEETMMLGGDHLNMCKVGRNDKRWDPVWRAIRCVSRGVGAECLPKMKRYTIRLGVNWRPAARHVTSAVLPT